MRSKIIPAVFVLSLFSVTARAGEVPMRFSLDSIFYGIAANDIYTDKSAYIIYTGSDNMSVGLGAVKFPLNSTDTLSYSSDNEHVTVTNAGAVTSDGEPCAANITINAGSVSVTRPVYVSPPLTRFALSSNKLELFADKPEPVSLSVVTEPEGIAAGMIEWHSGDESIAHVDPTGRVLPNGIGTTSVYAQTADGEYTAKCTVYVGLYDVTLRAVFITNATDRIKTGTEYKLSAYLYPDNVKDKNMTWKSSDSTIISVDPDGTLHAAEPGKAVITVTAANGKTDSFEIESSPDVDGYTVVSKPVSQRLREFSVMPQFVKYSYTLDNMTELQMTREPVVYDEDRAPSYEELRRAIDPSSGASAVGKYQFIDLAQSNGTDAATLDRYLTGKGVLDGKGQVFLDAARRYGLSELYLVTHAVLESGSGTSQLASGVEVNGTVVYNIFGIGAFDAGAVRYGSEYAYGMGWTTVDAAIDGGARWISENYINNPIYHQTTLYKMRWNPDKPGEQQYATDISWATAQARIIKSMFDAFPNAELHYVIPLYIGENEFGLK
ncbi:MAG: Ig-like domain-containing protein [Clostridia bacterium]|nr:Ig-like domain-containing protein [Clostridia bacterium]